MPVVSETLHQPLIEQVAHRAHPLQQVILGDDGLHREGSRAGHRMGEIGMAVLKGA